MQNGYGDWSVNTTTVFDPEAVKWKHHIDFSEEIPGVDYDIATTTLMEASIIEMNYLMKNVNAS